MYMLTEVEKVVRIPPKDLKDDIDSVIDNLTWETYEGRLGEDKNFTVLIKNVRTVGPGRIVHGDGAVYQTVKFDDGLLHISQVMDDRVDIDETNQRLVGKDTGRYLAVGDIVKARVVSIDLNEKNPQESKIGLTMRQPGLGKLQWLEEDHNKKSEKNGGDE